MKAVVIPSPGSPAIELAEVPVPGIDDEEILVRVQAIGVGIHDSYFLPGEMRYPYPIGIEGAGIIVEVGARTQDFHEGERVAFVSSMQSKGGTWAEFVAVKASSLILSVPDDMSFVDAAAIPVAGNTILRAFDSLSLMPGGGTLFIAGGSGAIGTLAIQIACQRGWRVIASASLANHEYMRSLGAELTVDYRDPDWTDQVLQWMPGGVDAAITVQPDTSQTSLAVVRNGGLLISISGDTGASERDIRMETVSFGADVRAELRKLVADVADGSIHVEVERVYPFDEALDALSSVQSRHTRGKLIIAV